MKSIITIISFAAITITANSQINILRYNDNFSYLKSDSTFKKGWQKIKYIPLTRKTNVSFGGEIREQLQYYRNINFGDVPPGFSKSTTWQLWHRVMVHSNIELGKKIRVFAQLGSTFRFLNTNPLTPEIEENQLSLHQAFVDYRPNTAWMIRIGRQELFYGNHRLISFREGPNTRLTFDAAIIRHQSKKSKIDLLALSPVISNKGIFDDQTFKDLIIGIYATERLVRRAFNMDYYFLNYTSQRRQYNYIGGRERREIAGFRLFSDQPGTNYELEATYQFGKFNGLQISACSISADVSHQLIPKHKITAGVAGTYVTGDKDEHDKQLNTYNLLFSKPQYGLAAPIGATNMATITPYLKLNPTRKSNIYAGSNFMWRQSSQDGIYSPGAIETRPKTDRAFTSDKKRIGTLLVLETNYSINNHFSFALDGSYFFAGNYVKKTGKGRDIGYLSFKVSYKF